MGTLDYIVIALFAIAMIGIVVWVFKQKQKSSGENSARKSGCAGEVSEILCKSEICSGEGSGETRCKTCPESFWKSNG